MKSILTKSTILLCMLLAMETAHAGDITGKVTCNGKGVPGVVVTDGIDCVQTGPDGSYTLEKKRGVRHIYLSTPAGYLVENIKQTIPCFYKVYDSGTDVYDFVLEKNPRNDDRHVFTVQSDVQMTCGDDLKSYTEFLPDITDYLKPYEKKKWDVFGIDCGDIVGDTPSLFPGYIDSVARLGFPVYRAIGNHDMTYGGRTFEYSFKTFESFFGPCCFSFNKGKAHYIVLDNNFYVNRDYQYIGYIDERTFAWMEEDLKFVPEGSLVFVVMHIPGSLTPQLQWNALLQDETSNVSALYDMLKGYNAHIISGHTHFNLNVCPGDRIMEHNTAAVCGIWWKADICMDGTPIGYGVYEVNGNDVVWRYKSAGYPDDYQMRTYPAGRCAEYPGDIVANVWNWDDLWKVEWLEDGKNMGEMIHFTGYDPDAKDICADKERVVYDWISPVQTEHLFRATPKNPDARIEVRVTDRFGNAYRQAVK